jgi:hypothetical protein
MGLNKNIQFSILGTKKGISVFGLTWSKPFWYRKKGDLYGQYDTSSEPYDYPDMLFYSQYPLRNPHRIYGENELLSEPYYQHKIFPQASRVYFDAYYDLYRNKGGQRIYDRRFPKSVNKSAEDL